MQEIQKKLEQNVFYGVIYENYDGTLDLWDTISPHKNIIVEQMEKNKKYYNSPLYLVKIQITEIVQVVE
jgi:hypothetical protein